MQVNQTYFWDWNLATGHIGLSPNWSDTLGVVDEKASGKWLSSRIHPDDLAVFLCQLESRLGGSEEQDEFFFRLMNNDDRYLRFISKGIIVMQSNEGRAEHVIWASELLELAYN